MIFMILISLFCSAYSQERSVQDISLAGIRLAEQRLPIPLKDFLLKKEKNMKIGLKWMENSLQWVRLNEVLLMPRAKLRIQIPTHESNYHVLYLNKVYLLQSYKGRAVLDLWVSLFRAEPITIIKGDSTFEVINVSVQKSKETKTSQLIDYSCAPWHIEINGLDDDYLSVGCQFNRSGKVGEEVPHLEILWSAASYRLADNSPSPYYASITSSHPIEFEVKIIKTKREKSQLNLNYLNA